MNTKGFSMVEVVTSLVILAVAMVGLGSTTARLARVADDAEIRALARQAVDDRIARIRLHPAYEDLDSVFSEGGAEVQGLPEFRRSTTVTRIRAPGEGEGKRLDYTRITVSVAAPGLESPVSKTVVLGTS